MRNPRKGELLIGVADIPNCCRASVRETHVTVDGGGFLSGQFHKLLNKEYRLGAMTAEMKFLVNHVNGHFMPDAVNLLIAFIHFVKVDFAYVME